MTQGAVKIEIGSILLLLKIGLSEYLLNSIPFFETHNPAINE